MSFISLTFFLIINHSIIMMQYLRSVNTVSSEKDKIDCLISRLSSNKHKKLHFVSPLPSQQQRNQVINLVNSPSISIHSADSVEFLFKMSNSSSNNTSSEQQQNTENSSVSNANSKCEALPQYFNNIKDLGDHCHNNKDKLVSNTNGKDCSTLLDGRSKKYISSKKSIMRKFFEILAKHSIFRHFCKLVPDPSFQNRELPLFFTTFRGPKSEDKKYLFNQILFHFVVNMKKNGYENVNLLDNEFTDLHATACYQPNTMDSRMKELFAQFHENGIVYSHINDFNHPGGFANFFQTIWAKCSNLRSDFGILPNAATFDQNSEQKIRENGNYGYKNNYNDCLELLIHNTLKLFQLRGGCEVSSYF